MVMSFNDIIVTTKTNEEIPATQVVVAYETFLKAMAQSIEDQTTGNGPHAALSSDGPLSEMKNAKTQEAFNAAHAKVAAITAPLYSPAEFLLPAHGDDAHKAFRTLESIGVFDEEKARRPNVPTEATGGHYFDHGLTCG